MDRFDDGPRARGHLVFDARIWTRIRREYAAGASAGWLAARYGPGERTIYGRARKEGWLRRDLAAASAEMALRELEAERAAGELAAGAAAADEPDDEAAAPEAMRAAALRGASMALARGRPDEAAAYLRLTAALEKLAPETADEGED